MKALAQTPALTILGKRGLEQRRLAKVCLVDVCLMVLWSRGGKEKWERGEREGERQFLQLVAG